MIMASLTPEQLGALAAAAIAAPSADNRHRFRIACPADDALSLLATEDDQDAAPHRRILGLLSMGAVVENVRLRAGRLGLHLEPDRPRAISGERMSVRFSIREAAPSDDPLEAAIEQRHSNRQLLFRGPPLSEALRSPLSQEAAQVPSSALTWLDTPEQRRRALRLIRLAETERFRSEALHRELFESIRFDAGWRVTTSEGLPPGSLALPGFERPAFSLLRHWGVQRIANWLGVHHFIGWRAADLPCRLAPHLCVIGASGDLDDAALDAGRLLQRVWLHATTLGLSCQVFAASPLYALPESRAVDDRLQQQLAAGWAALFPVGRPFLVLRLGRADAPSVRAGRPDPQSLIGTGGAP
jgi:hypothetical protein